MTDTQTPGSGPSGEHQPSGWVLLGVGLIALGFFLGARNLDLIPWPIVRLWEMVVEARTGIGVILVGILLIVWAQSGHRFTAPTRGRKFLRSQDDKWVAGVLGGLADYFGFEATLLRIAFIVLVVLFDAGALIVVYIIMAIIVPMAPKSVVPNDATT